FREGHPLYLTHEVHCDLSKLDSVVPNFLGGTLPRKDQGDREFYCATMLTLFKPWRLASDLRSSMQTWDDAFIAYDFRPQDVRYMANFNLKYECLDNRDDYHAELKKKTRFAAESGKQFDSDVEYTSDEYESDGEGLCVERNPYKFAGPRWKAQQGSRMVMESIVKDAGWTERHPEHKHGTDFTRYFPTDALSAAGWKNTL
ncbi:hypothetical protein CPC08DRAFT_611116, partial [Agrocybe pediades]